MDIFSRIDESLHPTKTGIVVLSTTCPECGKVHSTEVDVEAWNRGKLLYVGGALMQDAFPSFSPSQREMFITGICDSCWDKIFS